MLIFALREILVDLDLIKGLNTLGLDLFYRIFCGCLEIALIVLALYCTTKAWNVYRERHSLTSKYLVFSFLFLGLFPLGTLTDVFFQTLGEVTALYELPYGYAFTILFLGLFINSTLLFTTEVFARGGTKLSRGTVIFRVVLIVLFEFLTIWTSVFFFTGAIEETRLMISLISISAPVVYLLIFVRAHALARWVQEIEYKRPIRYIGNYGLLFGIGHIFSILDSLQPPGYSSYAVISWVLYLAAGGVMYLGFIRPQKKRQIDVK